MKIENAKQVERLLEERNHCLKILRIIDKRAINVIKMDNAIKVSFNDGLMNSEANLSYKLIKIFENSLYTRIAEIEKELLEL